MALDIERIVRYLAMPHKKKFVYQGKELSLEETCALDGGLPILVKKANMLCDFLFGAPLKVSFTSEGDSLTGEIVKISDQQKPFILVMLLYDVLEELVVSAGDGDVVLA